MIAAGLLRLWWPDDVWSQLLESAACLGGAVVCGLIIGMERERSQKPAGVRTHVLVSLGAAAFVHIGLIGNQLGHFSNVTDFNRLIQSVATGIGFLGAGAIFRARDRVQGVTTAASIWIIGAVGAAAGAGALAFALMISLFGYAVLRWLRFLDRRIEG